VTRVLFFLLFFVCVNYVLAQTSKPEPKADTKIDTIRLHGVQVKKQAKEIGVELAEEQLQLACDYWHWANRVCVKQKTKLADDTKDDIVMAASRAEKIEDIYKNVVEDINSAIKSIDKELPKLIADYEIKWNIAQRNPGRISGGGATTSSIAIMRGAMQSSYSPSRSEKESWKAFDDIIDLTKKQKQYFMLLEFHRDTLESCKFSTLVSKLSSTDEARKYEVAKTLLSTAVEWKNTSYYKRLIASAHMIDPMLLFAGEKPKSERCLLIMSARLIKDLESACENPSLRQEKIQDIKKTYLPLIQTKYKEMQSPSKI